MWVLLSLACLAFALTTQARKLLAQRYRQQGYEAQAFFYDSPDKQSRDTFVAQKEKTQATALKEFIAAVAVADMQKMLQLLPLFTNEYFWEKKGFDFSDALRAVPREKRQAVIDFFQEHRIAKITISEDGSSIQMGHISL